jgi:hypothetical protein
MNALGDFAGRVDDCYMLDLVDTISSMSKAQVGSIVYTYTYIYVYIYIYIYRYIYIYVNMYMYV